MCHSIRLIFLASGCGALAACGGSGSGGPRSTPIYVEEPDDGPAQVPTEAPEGSIALQSTEPFAVLAIESQFTASLDGETTVYTGVGPQEAEVEFERRDSDGAYVISFPGFNPGVISPTSYSGGYDSSGWTSVSGSYSELLDGDSGSQGVNVYLSWPQGPLNPNDLSYTSWGHWTQSYSSEAPPDVVRTGVFAYGIPTDAAAMPRIGTASYSAVVIGSTDEPYYGIDGSVSLLFDFEAGTLAGEMRPYICYWDCDSLGTYTFIDTVYASGSTSFSGAFAIDGTPVDSWFHGLFNGPAADELMAIWRAPYTAYAGTDGEQSGTMSGIWIGRKD